MCIHKPNFFIIGAPKCGTTALSEYLRKHPCVFFSEPKEPHFFNTDFANRYTRSLEDYQNIFFSAKPEQKVIGEGSVFYLVSNNAVKNILEYNPSARFIVMLRNPVDAVHAWHAQALYSFGEDVRDFEHAWTLQSARQKGKDIPRDCREVKVLMYGPLFKLGEQLGRLYQLVPRHKVHVVLFDEFSARTDVAYGQVLDFLGLDDTGADSFAQVNANRMYRSWLLERIIRYSSRGKRALGIRRPLGIRSRVASWNTTVHPRDPLDVSTLEMLKDYFRDDVGTLSELVGRDLSGWVRAA